MWWIFLACTPEPTTTPVVHVADSGESGAVTRDSGGAIEPYDPGHTLVAEGVLVADGDTLVLGTVEQGGASPSLDLVLTNASSTELSVSASVEGMSWGTAPPDALAAGATVAFSVEMATDTVGTVVGSMEIAGLSAELVGTVESPPPLVVVGDDGRVLVSLDYGATFMSDTQTDNTQHKHRGICWGGGRFVRVGGSSAGLVYTSEDGIDWDKAYNPTQGWIHACAYGEETFVLVGTNGNLAAGPNDGSTWVEVYTDNDERLEAVAYGDDVFIAVGGERRAMTEDGLSWASDELHEDTSLVALAYGDGVFVGVGRDGVVAATSDRGETWTDSTLTDCTLHGVAWTGEHFITGCKGRDNYVSTDGLSWTEEASDSLVFPLTHLGGWLWGLSGENGLFRTENGLDWEEVKEQDTGPALSAMALGGER